MKSLGLALFLIMKSKSPIIAQNMLEPVNLSHQTGWEQDDHQKALETFQRSCHEILATGSGFRRAVKFGGTVENWQTVCRKASSAKNAKAFFEEQFVAFKVSDAARPEGLFTGYYEPVVEGSLTQTAEYPVPVYSKPSDLVSFDQAGQNRTGLAYGRIINGQAEPYFTRRDIEQGALQNHGLEICFLKSWVDAFFIHIQGSGRVRLHDGKFIRLAYAAKSGQPYTGIGHVLLEKNVGTKNTMSMEFLREWMKDHPQDARSLMWSNKSYIFFRTISVPSDDLGALGAQQVNLTPLRSLAVDRSIWMFGTPMWIDTTTPPESGSKPFRHLMIAQDTGTAIKGHVRGDVYWGWGPEASFNAGHMKSAGSMVVLLPKLVAAKLIHDP